MDQFLDPERVQLNVPPARALFIEAHVVKIGDEAEDVVFQEVEEENQGDGDAADGDNDENIGTNQSMMTIALQQAPWKANGKDFAAATVC